MAGDATMIAAGRFLLASMVVASSASPPRDARGLPLATLTRAEMTAAGTVDVGCYWSLPGERSVRFAAAADHAAVKIGGRLVRLRPANGARDMFPFTYDAWTGGDLRLTVVKARGGRRRGSTIANEAALTLITASGSRVIDGNLECGD